MARAPLAGLAVALAAGCGARPPSPPSALPRPPPSPSSLGAHGVPRERTEPGGAGGGERPPVTEITTRPAPAPTLGTPIGPGGPFSFVAADPERRWVAVCAAARDTNGDGRISVAVSPRGGTVGDALDGFFVAGEGTPEAVDAFLGSDPSGRWVALEVHGALVLRDLLLRTETDLSALGADLRDDLASFVHPRPVAFDPAGKRLLYIRSDANGSRVVIRELETGGEVVVNAPEGSLHRADFDASSEWVVLRVVTTDTDQNGRIEWPVPEAPAHTRCEGPLPRYAAWERPRDEPATFVVRSTGGTPVEAPGLVTPLGEDVIVREPDGTLARLAPDGRRTLASRKGCASRLLHADARRQELLVTCTDKPGKHTAVLVGPNGARDLALGLAAAAGDHVIPGSPRLVPLHPGADAVLVDLDSGTVEALRSGDRILGTAGERALVLRGRSLVVHTLHGDEQSLSGEVDPFGHVRRTGSTFFVPPFVVDLGRGVLVGKSGARALAVATDGSLLVAATPADATRLAGGPLSWVAPEKN
ncbi:MAG TPA: hypothetical protein VHE30_20725 [Polyangiaceae bacterium]|nr:hypothetical protein [Polyangiaceae bacterium]